MSKFLLNLLVQISKALIYSKIKFYSEIFFPHFRPNRPSSQPAHPEFRPSSPNNPTGHLLPLPHRSQTHKVPPPACLALPPQSTPTPSTGRKKWPHQSPFIPPLIGATPPFQTPVIGAFKPGPLKLLQHRPLKALGLPHLASAL
jgi:hypothetical protein